MQAIKDACLEDDFSEQKNIKSFFPSLYTTLNGKTEA